MRRFIFFFVETIKNLFANFLMEKRLNYFFTQSYTKKFKIFKGKKVCLFARDENSSYTKSTHNIRDTNRGHNLHHVVFTRYQCFTIHAEHAVLVVTNVL